jgi:hypothetical protein
MIRVVIGSKTFGLTFPHEYEKKEVEKSTGSGEQGKVVNLYPKATYCELHQLDKEGKSERILARSRALIASKGRVKDNFSYEMGRKIALRRALKQFGLTRGERTVFWQTYHARPRPISVKKTKEVEPAQPVEGSSQGDGYFEPARAVHTLDLNAGEAH